MARNIYINGETLVQVKGGSHNSGFAISRLSELGLSTDPIQINFQFNYRDLKTSDFGPTTPPEIQYNLASCTIDMTLVHFDSAVLDVCMSESMGGSYNQVIPDVPRAFGAIAGMMVGAGTTLGHGLPLLASGNHYISVNLTAPQRQIGSHWRFRSCHLTGPPTYFPLGTSRSLVKVQFRAIPYRPLYYYTSGASLGETGAINIQGFVYLPREITSSGTVLWDNQPDTEGEVRVPLN